VLPLKHQSVIITTQNILCMVLQVVLASMQDLTCGFAKDLFIEWAEDEKNSIIFSTRTAPGSLARNLIDNPNTTKVDLEVQYIEVTGHTQHHQAIKLLNTLVQTMN
jgi:Cft2 family RNA processing exonuclease